MAKQLNLLSTGQVIPTALHSEMQQSYLEYAMSVIVGRALPDIRDGLKPVHRRILYAMHELGLTPDRPYRKCARVVGDVLGKYHPHGDQSVYDALVRMVQNFSSRYPLLDGHGNFGSVDNDPPAAMRYTETRLASVSHEAMLAEIDWATVDFIGNFDNSQQEPVVLPAQLPILLLNGCGGIAVGMATNIPPHNLGEIVDGLVALIDRPDLPDEKLFELIPGPDFPTGGAIVETEGIRAAYTTGKGSIVVRGIAKIEEIVGGAPRKKGGRQLRAAIVVTELPFQVNKAAWIEKMAELVNQGRIEGISDIRDESDRDGMRVVIELKKEFNPQEVLGHLYHQTALQTTFGAILLAIVEGQPRQLTLRDLLQKFLEFREHTLTRRYTHELNETENRLHILEGLLKALTNLDRAIDILRKAPDGTTAKATLQNRLELSDRQADAILAMPLRRITGLEQENLRQEFDQLTQRRQELQLLLSDRRELLKALKKDLRSLKKKYGDERRTRIQTPSSVGAFSANNPAVKQPTSKQNPPSSQEPKNKATGEKKTKKDNSDEPTLPLFADAAITKAQLPEEEAIVEFTHRGYVRRLPVNNQASGKKRKAGSATAANDFLTMTQPTKTNQDVLVLTRTGKAFAIKVGDIPSANGRDAKGTPLVTLLPPSAQGNPEAIASQFVVSDYLDSQSLIMVSQQGKIKRLQLLELANMTGRGLTIMKLQTDDQLLLVQLASPGEQVVLATSAGRLLRVDINEEQLPSMGRAAQGNQATRLRQKELLVSCARVSGKRDRGELLLVSEEGYAKRLPLHLLRPGNRGDIGTQMLHFASKTDALAGMVAASGIAEVMLVTSADRLLRLAVDSVVICGKDGTGDRVVSLNPNEKVVSLVIPAPEPS